MKENEAEGQDPPPAEPHDGADANGNTEGAAEVGAAQDEQSKTQKNNG